MINEPMVIAVKTEHINKLKEIYSQNLPKEVIEETIPTNADLLASSINSPEVAPAVEEVTPVVEPQVAPVFENPAPNVFEEQPIINTVEPVKEETIIDVKSEFAPNNMPVDLGKLRTAISNVYVAIAGLEEVIDEMEKTNTSTINAEPVVTEPVMENPIVSEPVFEQSEPVFSTPAPAPVTEPQDNLNMFNPNPEMVGNIFDEPQGMAKVA